MKSSLLTPALAAIVGLVLAGLPTSSYAQTTTAPASTAAAKKTNVSPHTMGTVTAVDTAGNTISVQNAKDGTRMFSIASTAKITKDKKTATLAEFAVGDHVSIVYTTDASGTLTATALTKMATPATQTGGTVTAVDAGGNSISIQNKKDGVRMFSVPATAKITKDKKPATLADFAVGDRVSIGYNKDATGNMVVTTLSKTTPKTKAPSSTTSSSSSTAPAKPAGGSTTTSNM